MPEPVQAAAQSALEKKLNKTLKSIDAKKAGIVAASATGLAGIGMAAASVSASAERVKQVAEVIEEAVEEPEPEPEVIEQESEPESEVIEQESEPEPEPEPEPEVIQEEVQVIEEASIKLHDLVHQLGEARFASERSAIMDSIDGGAYNFSIEVSGVERTLGIGLNEYLRGGRSLAGNVVGDDIEVLIRMPSSRNEEMDNSKGSIIELNATASDWNNLRKRLDMNHIE